jgi:hypothetical protein
MKGIAALTLAFFVCHLYVCVAIVRMDNGYPMTRAEESSLQASEKKKDEVLRGAPKADDE